MWRERKWQGSLRVAREDSLSYVLMPPSKVCPQWHELMARRVLHFSAFIKGLLVMMIVAYAQFAYV